MRFEMRLRSKLLLACTVMHLPWMPVAEAVGDRCVAQRVYEAAGGRLRTLENAPVEFPRSSRLLHWVGPDEALYEITVDRDGRVIRAAVLRSTDPELGASGLVAVRKWRYEPPKLHQKSVCVDATVAMEWKFSPDIK